MPDQAEETPKCECGCGNDAAVGCSYAGETDKERSRHRAQAQRSRDAAAQAERVRASARGAILHKMGLESAQLPSLATTAGALAPQLLALIDEIVVRAASIDETRVLRSEQRIRHEAAEQLLAAEQRCHELQATLLEAQTTASSAQARAAEAASEAAAVALVIIETERQLEIAQREGESTSAALSEQQERATCAESELRRVNKILRLQQDRVNELTQQLDRHRRSA